jgi:hypothetical protein
VAGRKSKAADNADGTVAYETDDTGGRAPAVTRLGEPAAGLGRPKRYQVLGRCVLVLRT